MPTVASGARSAGTCPTAPSTPLRTALALLLAALLLSGAPRGRAADPQPYTVAIAPTGIAALDGAVHDASTLISLRDTAPVGPFALVARARDDRTRFLAALHSFGYYDGAVGITIDGHPLDDPDLPHAAGRDVPAGHQGARSRSRSRPGRCSISAR